MDRNSPERGGPGAGYEPWNPDTALSLTLCALFYVFLSFQPRERGTAVSLIEGSERNSCAPPEVPVVLGVPSSEPPPPRLTSDPACRAILPSSLPAVSCFSSLMSESVCGPWMAISQGRSAPHPASSGSCWAPHSLSLEV